MIGARRFLARAGARGRAVRGGDQLTRLRAAGEVSATEGDLTDLPEPLALEPGQESASEVLARLRRDEPERAVYR